MGDLGKSSNKDAAQMIFFMFVFANTPSALFVSRALLISGHSAVPFRGEGELSGGVRAAGEASQRVAVRRSLCL